MKTPSLTSIPSVYGNKQLAHASRTTSSTCSQSFDSLLSATKAETSGLASAIGTVTSPLDLASKAAELGLSRDQIAKVIQWKDLSAKDMQGIAQDVTAWVADSANGYVWNASGKLEKSSAPKLDATELAKQNDTTINLAGTVFSAQQLRDFFVQGQSMNQYLQQRGVTDPVEIHQLNAKAQNFVGSGVPQGEAALKIYFKQYQTYNPDGAHANDFEGWKADQSPTTLTAMLAGGYSGPVVSNVDFEFDGIYGPQSSYYGKTGYGSGLGPRGMGALGGNWGETGSARSILKA